MALNTGEVFTYKKIIDYSVDAVVSKTLVDKKNCTITLFAFSKGQRLSEHSTPFLAIVHIVEGTAKVQIAGQPFILTEGKAIVFPPNVPHAVDAVEDFKMVLTMVKEL